MRGKLKVAALLISLTVMLTATLGWGGFLSHLSGYLRTESGVKVKMVTPKIGSRQANESAETGLVADPHTSALRGNESGVVIDGNIYTRGVGLSLDEGGVNIYSVPEDAFKSYKEGITAADEGTTTTTTTTTSTTTTPGATSSSTSTTTSTTTLPGGGEEVDVQLTQDWNLISLPLSL